MASNPLSIEARLDWLIVEGRIVLGAPERRLNAIKNVMCNLASGWRPIHPIDPAIELRMSERTRDALGAWVEARELAIDEAGLRLEVYRSDAVLDATVPEGWIRLNAAHVSSEVA